MTNHHPVPCGYFSVWMVVGWLVGCHAGRVIYSLWCVSWGRHARDGGVGEAQTTAYIPLPQPLARWAGIVRVEPSNMNVDWVA